MGDGDTAGRVDTVEDLQLQPFDGRVQEPGPVDEGLDRHLGAVHPDGVGVHLAEGGDGVVTFGRGFGPQPQDTVHEIHHASSFAQCGQAC
jgi:hypothetical protein